MSSRKVYAGAVIVLLAVVMVIAGRTSPKTVRSEQHLNDSTAAADDNLSLDAEHFSSHLPVVNIETGGKTIPGIPEDGQHVNEVPNTFSTAHMQILDEEGQLNTLGQKPEVDSDVQIRVRGNSSRRFDKVGYLFKFVDGSGQQTEHAVMGMEKDSTWVLHGPYLDKTLMRNYMWYNLSGQIMEWAPDVRYCEVFLDGAYQGVYVMTEQISVGEGRIEVTGYNGKAPVSSYVVCVDRQSVNDVEYLDNFSSYTRRSRSKVEIKYPGAKKINEDVAEYISRDFSEFEKSLYSYDYDTELYGYRNYIDIDSFVDYFIINEVTQNTDAGIYSTYFYKDVSGKLKTCVWDFNNCCDNYIEEQTSMAGYFMQGRTWFYMLMKDEAFTQKIIDRYKSLRQGILSDEAMKEYIQGTREYLGTAVDRNFEVWGYSFEPEHDLLPDEERKIGSYNDAVQQYERRLISRLGWMDKHIEDLDFYSHESKNKKFNH